VTSEGNQEEVEQDKSKLSSRKVEKRLSRGTQLIAYFIGKQEASSLKLKKKHDSKVKGRNDAQDIQIGINMSKATLKKAKSAMTYEKSFQKSKQAKNNKMSTDQLQKISNNFHGFEFSNKGFSHGHKSKYSPFFDGISKHINRGSQGIGANPASLR